MTQLKSARELAYYILFEFERNHNRIDILERRYLTNVSLSPQDRQFVKQIISGSIRYLLYLDWIIGKLYHGRLSKLLNKTKTILRLALYEIIYLDNIPEYATVNEYVSLSKRKVNPKQGALVNAILRNYLKQSSEFNPDKQITNKSDLISIKYSFPKWLVSRWTEQWGIEKTERLCIAFNREPDFDININTVKISPDQMKIKLRDKNIEFQKSDLFDEIFKIKNIQKLIHSELLDEGFCSVQDESAHIPVELLAVQAGDTVLDMCAAPGGKYIQILQKQKSITAVAVDIDKNRLERIKENMQRLCLNNGFIIVADARNLPFKPVFNKILLDAPCSGIGVISKHPDIKWRRSDSEIQSFSNLQIELLQQAGNCLKNDGRLVYSTCTIEIEENEDITNKFLEKNFKHYKQQDPPKHYKHLQNYGYIRTFPDVNYMDGSFCAIIKKI
jgi:16S rRNA (cytosine967-C5)-methyltransferase